MSCFIVRILLSCTDMNAWYMYCTEYSEILDNKIKPHSALL